MGGALTDQDRGRMPRSGETAKPAAAPSDRSTTRKANCDLATPAAAGHALVKQAPAAACAPHEEVNAQGR